MSIEVNWSQDDSFTDLEFSDNQKQYQLLGRGVTFKAAALGEIVELIGVALTNAGVFSENRDLTLGGLITSAVGIGTIFVIESTVMKRGYDADIPLDINLIKRIVIRGLGGIALIAGYFTIIAGYVKDDQQYLVGGTATMDVGVLTGLVGLYLLRDYL